MQCSRQGGDAAAVARRRELAFVTSSARGLPSRPGRNSGAQSQGGHRVALRVPGLRPADSWSRDHATCREDPEPRREDGCRQACREEGREIESQKHRRERNIDQLPPAHPPLGKRLQPKHMLLTGTKPGTLQSAGRRSIH
ncbi:hypothetical protein MDA_GLEAN10018223 [Myotis davidii]|uniref:Uncharacterized protein n=1 Tax=Myotis davidii TaxID=225400 RepID=L5M4S1_MYODS|nr:hypothetical protein MDA_GLEAN10018223 [Myotis davidii]